MLSGVRHVGEAQIPWMAQLGSNATCDARHHRNSNAMLVLSLLLSTLLSEVCPQALPEQAQFVDQKSFNNLQTVPPPSVSNLTVVRHSLKDTQLGTHGRLMMTV